MRWLAMSCVLALVAGVAVSVATMGEETSTSAKGETTAPAGNRATSNPAAVRIETPLPGSLVSGDPLVVKLTTARDVTSVLVSLSLDPPTVMG